MRRSILFFLVLLSTHSVSAQQAGATDYAVGGSSVMWIQGPSSLFLNPAELSRIHEGDFGLNTSKFTGLSSFTGSFFEPSAGTFAAGVGVAGTVSQYTAGYATHIGRYHGFGVALSGFRGTEESFGVSLGGSVHFPNAIENSGIHGGFSIMNVSETATSPFFSVNFGAAYWVAENAVRVQAAFQHTATKNFGLLGSEFLLIPDVGLQIGTRSFKDFSAGISVKFHHGSISLGAGKPGVFFSVRAALTALAADNRDSYYELGQEAADDERMTEAVALYRKAADYDPYFTAGQTAADTIEEGLRTKTDKALHGAGELLAQRNFMEATKAYSRILRMDPENEEARKNLNSVQPRMRSYIDHLIASGDSLRDLRQLDDARKMYDQAQELDSENQGLEERIASLPDLAREGIRLGLIRARNRLNRNQLDEAQKEYEQVLAAEPRNSQARQGLATIQSKRRDLEVERGKSLVGEGKYMDAILVFLDVLKQDDRHREAKAQLDSARTILLPEVDVYFRSGLQFYTKEDYKSALAEWAKGLLIDPNHQGTIEYKNRAEEKLKALERLK